MNVLQKQRRNTISRFRSTVFELNYPLAMPRTGRSRLEHRHGWQGVEMARCRMAECPCSRDGEKGTFRNLYFLTSKILTIAK
jgi:hypothetical protein